MVDSSGSLREEDDFGNLLFDNFPLVKEFLVKVGRRYDISPDDIRMGIVQFGDDVQVELQLRDGVSFDNFESAVDSMQMLDGRTMIFEAIQDATDMFIANPRTNAQRVMVVLTDGSPSDAGENEENYLAAKAAAASAGITMMSKFTFVF